MDQIIVELFARIERLEKRIKKLERKQKPKIEGAIELCLQSGKAFKKKSISLSNNAEYVAIMISNRKLREIRAAFPDIPEEG